MDPWSTRLARLQACSEAVAWSLDLPDLPTAWGTCQRVDWMFWLLARDAQALADRHMIVKANVDLYRAAPQTSSFATWIDMARALASTHEDEQRAREREQRFHAAGDLAATALATGVRKLLRLARTAPLVADDDDLLKWAQAATRPVAFLALAQSNATFAATGDRAQAQQAAADVLRRGAEHVRSVVPADKVPISLYHPSQDTRS